MLRQRAEEEREAKRDEMQKRAKKRRIIPPFCMLLAGAVTAIVLFALRYSLRIWLCSLLLVMIVFFCIGEVIEYMFDRFDVQLENAWEEEQKKEEQARFAQAAAEKTETEEEAESQEQEEEQEAEEET